jgi:hypothetical protein
MNRSKGFGYGVLVAPALALLSGCIIIPGGWEHPSAWTESVEETRALPTSGMDDLRVKTHNGSITVHAMDGQGSPTIAISKKTGGWTPDSAEAAMDALDVFVEPDGGGGVTVGWKWQGVRRPDWRAQVNFDIRAPSRVNLRARTHNGPVHVNGLDSRVDVGTHNGRVQVDSRGESLQAHTHNGRIIAAYAGDSVTLTTHNGGVQADLAACNEIRGKIQTHNGNVVVELGPQASLELVSRTHNGSIKCETAISNAVVKRHHVTGTIGDGGGTLKVVTHNGGIKVAKKDS